MSSEKKESSAKILNEEPRMLLEARLLRAFLTDPELMIRVEPLFQPSYFSDEAMQDIAAIGLEHFQKFGTLPDIPTLCVMVDDRLTLLDADEEEGELYQQLINVIYSDAPAVSPDYMIEDFIRYCQLEGLRETCSEVIEQGESKKADPRKLMTFTMQRISALEPVALKIYTMSPSDTRKTLEELKTHHEQTIELPWHDVNVALGGAGVERKSVVCIASKHKQGKSEILQAAATYWWRTKKNVVYFSHELTGLQIMARSYANVSGIREKDLIFPNNMRQVEDRVLMLAPNAGKLCVIFLPTGTRVDRIDAALQILKRRDGFEPDIIIDDYPDRLLPVLRAGRGYSKTYEMLTDVYSYFRDLCVSRNALGVVVSQTKQAAFEKERLDDNDLGGLYDKNAIVDYLFSFTVREKIENVGRGTFHINHSRHEVSSNVFDIKLDYPIHRVEITVCDEVEAPPCEGDGHPIVDGTDDQAVYLDQANQEEYMEVDVPDPDGNIAVLNLAAAVEEDATHGNNL